MKKTILIASVLSLFITANFASASNLNEILPGDTNLYFEFDTTGENILKDYFVTEVPKNFSQSIFSSDEKTQAEKLRKAYSDIFTSNTVSIGVDFPEDIVFELKITDTQYQNFLDALGSEATIESENPKIYGTKDDSFFTKSGDLLLVSSTKEKLISVLNYTGENLNNNDGYKSVSSEFNTDDTLTLYISNTVFNSLFNEKPEVLNTVKSVTEAFKAIGFTLKKTSTGVNTKIITAFSPEKAKELGINTSANNFTPLLYKSMPSENPIFYTEFSNLKSTIKTVLSLLSKTGKVDQSKLEIPAAADAYLSILEEETAIYVQKDSQILPAITIVFNTSAHKDIATEIVTTLTTALENELINNNVEYQKSTNKKLTTFTFDLNSFDKESQIPAALSQFSVTLGTTPENYLLFSTYSKIASEYGQGLSKNSKFKNAFSNLNQTVSGISYFSIENFASWYDQILSTAALTTDNEYIKKEIANTRQLLNKVKAPWHDMGFISKTTEKNTTTEINFNFDLKAIDLDYIYLVDEFSSSLEKSFKGFKNSRQTFNDTPTDGWYYNDVKELNARGVIKGYEDKSFKPEKSITRAEFLTMILRAFDDNNFEKNYAKAASNFKDVSTDDWFSSAVAKGTSDGLIKGYNDNSFRPNSPITRAEAISILSKAIKLKYGEDLPLANREFTNQFSDVKESDWSYEDVKKLYIYSIVDGDSNGKTFSPNRNINRAEASKIINKTIKGIESMNKDNSIQSVTVSKIASVSTHPEQGNADAPVIVQEFLDYQCPSCQLFHSQLFPGIKEKYIDTGKVKFVYYNFPLSSIHEDAYPAAKFAECSFKESDDSTFLEIQDKLYETMTNGKFDYSTMSKFASSIGIGEKSLKNCFDKDQYKNEISADVKYGEKQGITGTPGFIVNGTVIIGASDELAKTIDSELLKIE